MGALVADVCLVGVPGGDLVVEEEVVGGGGDVAGLIGVGGRVRCGGGERGGAGRGGHTVWDGGGVGSGAGGGCCGGLEGEGLVECALVRGRIAADPGDVGGVVDGDRLGVLVLGVVLLGVDLFVLLEVLRPLERLFADLGRVSGARRGGAGGGPTSQMWGLRGVCTGGG